MKRIRRKRRALWPFLVLAIAVGIAALLVPRTPQPLSYHHFADQRTWLGVPNFGDVVSNLLFLLAGVLGLVFSGICRNNEAPATCDSMLRSNSTLYWRCWPRCCFLHALYPGLGLARCSEFLCPRKSL
jgi:hypothetical protein